MTPQGIALPAGYSLDTPSVNPSVSTGADLYGGATMNWCQDGRGVWYLGCNADYNGSDFKFRIFWLGAGGVLTELQGLDTGDGRGWLDVSNYDGRMYYSSWKGENCRPPNGPGLVPGAVPVSSGGYVPCVPMRVASAVDGQLVSGGRWLDMAALFGVPPGCRAYDVRFVVQAPSPDVRGRLGTETIPGEYTVNTQVGGLAIHSAPSRVNADANGNIYLSIAPAGASANAWVHVCGYWQ
jgi:hypothetical protein